MFELRKEMKSRLNKLPYYRVKKLALKTLIHNYKSKEPISPRNLIQMVKLRRNMKIEKRKRL